MWDQERPRSSITAAGLERLLARLGDNRDRAAQEYERLRRALVRFFDWRGIWPPEECADETLDRLARKLELDVEVLDVNQYTYGIARLVMLERARRPRPAPIEAAAISTLATTSTDSTIDALHSCLDRCLARIPDDGRQLLLRYYEGERGSRIANRRTLAATFNLSADALRSRVQRLRDRVEACVSTCVARR